MMLSFKQWVVSTHAPAKGATRLRLLSITVGCFNTRSREGSDGNLQSDQRTARSFNTRSREGSDQVGDEYHVIDYYVSTHAPAKGATTTGC